jgi:hypothetical protein
MRSVRTFILAWVAAACLFSRADAAYAVATFSTLRPGDSLEMTFHTSGCFHSATYELSFHRSEELEVHLVEVRRVWSEERKEISILRDDIGDLILTKADIQGLDLLLRFYRSKPRGGCTTTDQIEISQRHDGRVEGAERFTDGSCSVYERRDLTLIPELVARVQRRK